ncbi:flavin reductase family protein [Streptomyces sp. GS7]|uniref:flavin reductase family protein n=1 Tax=Streptomyces sp. GS7 TaxID=2692234 RepID=UPI001317E1E6|nr:flavin reductase family protein [Streptomyces sp. GS7]QHC22571.1 flavin reductase [Streptomyces sp. GS7]
MSAMAASPTATGPAPSAGTAGPDAAERRRFRRAAGRFPTGVTVVTATADGQPHGTTVNAFSTASMDPLMILVALGNDSRLREHALHSGSFAVTVLAAHQEADARHFADPARPPGAAGFAGRPWRTAGHARSPVLTEGVAAFDCSLAAAFPAGDHTVLLGRVERFDVLSDGPPLLFADSRLLPGP